MSGPYAKVKPHGLAIRYLWPYKGIEIGASANNPHYLPGTTFVDYTADHTRFKQVEIDLCGESQKVDVVAEADDLPFDDNSQDYVLTSHVFEHLPNPIKAIKEWIRVIHPGGLIFMVVPHPEGYGSHPGDHGKPITDLDHFQQDYDRAETIETHPIPEGHEERGHLHCFTYKSTKAFFAHFFPDELEWVDGEPIDAKTTVGHTHVYRVIKPALNGHPRIDVKPLRKRFWLNWPDTTGCTAYRQGYPVEQLQHEMSELGIDMNAGGIAGGTLPDSSYDAYFLQRATGHNQLSLVHWVKKAERKLIWDLDDDFFAIPEWSPAYKAVRADGSLMALPIYLDLADFITVTNQHLADRVVEEHDFLKGKLHVLPNLIDHTRYRIVPPRPDRRTRIMWTGSDFHAADLELLVPVVERIVKDTDWEIVFLGAMPPGVIRYPTDRVWQVAGAAIRYYPKLLCELAPDVALIPITGSLFDRSKSAIKWMECSLAGAACVATDFGPYAEAIKDGQTGILVQNDPDCWFAGIKAALDNRNTINMSARAEVIARHSWASPARQIWKDFFVRVADSISLDSQRPASSLLS